MANETEKKVSSVEATPDAQAKAKPDPEQGKAKTASVEATPDAQKKG